MKTTIKKEVKTDIEIEDGFYKHWETFYKVTPDSFIMLSNGYINATTPDRISEYMLSNFKERCTEEEFMNAYREILAKIDEVVNAILV